MNYDDRKRLKKQVSEAYRLNDNLDHKDVYTYLLIPVRFIELALRKTAYKSRRDCYYMWRKKVLRKQQISGYQAARGVLSWKSGDELPEDAIRRLRGGAKHDR